MPENDLAVAIPDSFPVHASARPCDCQAPGPLQILREDPSVKVALVRIGNRQSGQKHGSREFLAVERNPESKGEDLISKVFFPLSFESFWRCHLQSKGLNVR